MLDLPGPHSNDSSTTTKRNTRHDINFRILIIFLLCLNRNWLSFTSSESSKTPRNLLVNLCGMYFLWALAYKRCQLPPCLVLQLYTSQFCNKNFKMAVLISRCCCRYSKESLLLWCGWREANDFNISLAFNSEQGLTSISDMYTMLIKIHI